MYPATNRKRKHLDAENHQAGLLPCVQRHGHAAELLQPAGPERQTSDACPCLPAVHSEQLGFCYVLPPAAAIGPAEQGADYQWLNHVGHHPSGVAGGCFGSEV